MELKVSSSVIAALIEHAAQAAPEEACGILIGAHGMIAGVQRADNVHASPRTHFEIDPQTLIDCHRRARAGGPAIAGYYHSHPSGPPQPTATDQAMAAGDGAIWAIHGSGQVRFWHDLPGGFAALSYRAHEG